MTATAPSGASPLPATRACSFPAGPASRRQRRSSCDAAAGTIRERLTAESLDLAGLVTAAGPSDSSAILVDAAGENAIATLNERARGFDPLAAPGLRERLAPGVDRVDGRRVHVGADDPVAL